MHQSQHLQLQGYMILKQQYVKKEVGPGAVRHSQSNETLRAGVTMEGLAITVGSFTPNLRLCSGCYSEGGDTFVELKSE